MSVIDVFLVVFKEFWWVAMILAAAICMSIKAIYDESQYKRWIKDADSKDM